MKRFTTIAAIAASSCIALAAPSMSVAQTAQDDTRFQQAQDRFSRELSIYQQEFDRYQQARRTGYRGGGHYDNHDGYDRDDRDESGYDPSRYYRPGPNYQERVLSTDDRVYRGTDERYYCKRSDGTTGLILGAGVGGVLGNVIDVGHSRAVGPLLGAAVAGKAIGQGSSQNQIHCR